MSVLVLGLASYPSIIPDLDQSITTSNIQTQFVVPAFADEEEIELEGTIDSISDPSFELTLLNGTTITILTDGETEFEDGLEEFADLEVDLVVEVEVVPSNGDWLATEIEVEDEDEEEEVEEAEDEEFEEEGLHEEIVICHIPPGNPDKAHTITIDESALDDHLAHGDDDGPCDGQAPSTTDLDSEFAEKQAKREARLAEKQAERELRLAEKEVKAFQRAEDLIQKLEQRIADLEERLQTLLEKLETGEYYGNVPEVDSVINSYSISFNGTAFSLFDESVTTDVSGEIFFENLVTTSIVSKFKVTGGDVFVGNNIYDVVFGKARISSTGTSGEKDSMVLILQSIDSEENENTIRLTIHFDSALEGEFGTEPIGFEISPRSKISGQWSLSATGQLSLLQV